MHSRVLTTDEEIDESIAYAKTLSPETTIVETSYDADKNVLYLKLSDGRRLFVPKEELSELKNATSEQASDIVIVLQGSSLWWPQIGDGLHIQDFLEKRWHKLREQPSRKLPKAA